MPRNVTLMVERNLVQKIVPGTRVKVMGVYSLHSGGGDKGSKGKGNQVSQRYLNVVGLVEESEGTSRGFPKSGDTPFSRPVRDCLRVRPTATITNTTSTCAHTSQTHCSISQLVTVCPYIAVYSTTQH